MEAGVAVPITLDTNRADLISVTVSDYDSSSGSTKATVLVQVHYRVNCSVEWLTLLTRIFASSIIHRSSLLPTSLHRSPEKSSRFMIDICMRFEEYFINTQAMRQGSALVRVTYKINPQVVDWILVRNPIS